ncbi:TY3B-TY3B protein [Penicillium cf. griseofulvum]|uniref:TY3B-TY3B protein n=1 Tax=Penicillium cf. griseofulvum TaxID=2972120 RepID=A0A9W9MEV8_9EURO|nr:TY3B-TY3B protein [Penicillium cf. griseofulvum]KAJ5442184.1 TY3B-TY3B protein [Penicillium cf. griseofulvum]KAJ5450843.1 TY3B-TY3B protein [Penicillium cf. griseofulvum]
MVFGFQLNTPATNNVENPKEDRITNRLDATDAIPYAQQVMKARYDAGHIPLSLAVADLIYVRLDKGYNVPSKSYHKFGDQRASPFKVTKVLTNAYELALPPSWAVHPVISVRSEA